MIFSQDRDTLRKMYADAWQKHLQGKALSPLEAQIAKVVSEHPEYQAQLGDEQQEFRPEDGRTNPYLHMGLHLGLREQVATDRPVGIRQLFDRVASKMGDAHDAEHRMIECLAQALWDAQSKGQPPDEQAYLECLHRLAR